MKVREVLLEQSKQSLAGLSVQIEAFDQAQITKVEMYEKLATIVGEIIGHSFDFGFQLGVAAVPEDIKPGESVLDIDLTELPGEDTDAP